MDSPIARPRARFARRSLLALAPLLVGAALAPDISAALRPQDPAPETPSPPAKDPLARVAILGASVSAGFGIRQELEVRRDVPLGEFIGAFLAEPGATEFVELGDPWFFGNAAVAGSRQVARLRTVEPTAVVAVDFLFWYAFGRGEGADERRAAGLERGLALLDEIDAPLVVGDLPNVEHALRGKGPLGGPVVHRGLFPTEEERIAMNARIHAWAKEREDVIVAPLAEFMASVVRKEAIEIRGNGWTPGDLNEVLQPDLLHPGERGTLWVALALADALTKLDESAAERFDFDVEAAAKRIDAGLAERRETFAKRRASTERPVGSGSGGR